jgi:hypothetical protein
MKKFEEAGVDAKLVTKPAQPRWAGIDKDALTIANWFDAHLLKKTRRRRKLGA